MLAIVGSLLAAWVSCNRPLALLKLYHKIKALHKVMLAYFILGTYFTLGNSEYASNYYTYDV